MQFTKNQHFEKKKKEKEKKKERTRHKKGQRLSIPSANKDNYYLQK